MHATDLGSFPFGSRGELNLDCARRVRRSTVLSQGERSCSTHPRIGSGEGTGTGGLAGAAGLLLASAAGAAAQTPPVVPYTPNYVITSTMPANGDQNPYGVAFVPPDFPAGGKTAPGDILVSNFNNKKNLQGAGTTIIAYTPSSGKAIASPGTATVFFQPTASAVVGLDTALAVPRKGFVLVGFLPSGNCTFATHKRGGILVLDKSGAVVGSPMTNGDRQPLGHDGPRSRIDGPGVRFQCRQRERSRISHALHTVDIEDRRDV
jgi:hypothetical protein